MLSELLGNKLILLALGGAAAIVMVAMAVIYIKARLRMSALYKQLAHQLERVEIRKRKIFQLRSVIAYLLQENAEQREALNNRIDKSELQDYYGRIIDSLLRIYKRMDLRDEQKKAINNSDFCMLTQQIASSIGLENRTDMPWQQKSEKQTTEQEIRQIYNGKCVLIVDDNRNTGTALARILMMNGFRVENAESGEQAIEMFMHSPEGHYSFVFMDIVLNGLSGYETAREIRRSYRSDSERLPIIAMTANNFSEDLINIQNAGMNERLLKPVTEEKVIALIRKWKGLAEMVAQPYGSDSADGEKIEENYDETWESLNPDEASSARKGEASGPAEIINDQKTR